MRSHGWKAGEPLERVPPHDPAAEVAVLGACLLENGAVGQAAEVLTPAHFFREAHQQIFAACLTLFQQGEPVDLITVSNMLHHRGVLERVGGRSTLPLWSRRSPPPPMSATMRRSSGRRPSSGRSSSRPRSSWPRPIRMGTRFRST